MRGMRKTNVRFRHCAPGLPAAVIAALLVSGVSSFSGASERLEKARNRMITEDIAGRGIGNPQVLQAMRTVPRERFVPAALQRLAYSDRPLPIDHGQTISQPYIVAFMTEVLLLKPEDSVLEIGTGSGYQAAILAQIVANVYTIEIVEPLGKSAEELLEELSYTNVHMRVGDGYYGWPEQQPFDAIIVTAAASHIPPPLIEQLKPGGRMIIPVGTVMQVQHLLLIEKDKNGEVTQRNIMPVRFVPLTGGPRRNRK